MVMSSVMGLLKFVFLALNFSVAFAKIAQSLIDNHNVVVSPF